MYLTYYPIGTSGHRSSLYGSSLYGSSLYGYYSGYKPVYSGYAPAYAPPPPPQEPSGGITSELEYDPPTMLTFLCWCAFGMLNQNRKPSPEFEKVVVSILYATRLPKSTIIIALEYLNQRFSNTQAGPLPDQDIFLRVVVALVLANKFNDDNTFTNRSWCGASGLAVEVINAEEAAWLAEVNWRLNVVHFRSNIETLEECWRTWLDKYAACTAPPPAASLYPSPVPDSPYSYYSPYTAYGSIPLSPMSALSPVSPAKPDWRHRPNAYPSIWAYPPQYGGYYGYANPYYNCSMALC